ARGLCSSARARQVGLRHICFRLSLRSGCIGNCCGDNRRHPSSERRDITLAIGMHSIAEKHYECVTRRIDPERSSGKTRVTKRAEREQIAFVCTVTRGNVPAEAAGAIFTGSSWLGHRGDREGAENPPALI